MDSSSKINKNARGKLLGRNFWQKKYVKTAEKGREKAKKADKI